MKMNIRICGTSLQEIQTALLHLSNERLESNCTGFFDGVEYDYEFVDSDDLYSDDSNKDVISPNA